MNRWMPEKAWVYQWYFQKKKNKRGRIKNSKPRTATKRMSSKGECILYCGVGHCVIVVLAFHIVFSSCVLWTMNSELQYFYFVVQHHLRLGSLLLYLMEPSARKQEIYKYICVCVSEREKWVVVVVERECGWVVVEKRSDAGIQAYNIYRVVSKQTGYNPRRCNMKV